MLSSNTSNRVRSSVIIGHLYPVRVGGGVKLVSRRRHAATRASSVISLAMLAFCDRGGPDARMNGEHACT
jgi:hypothetical protein